MAPHDGNQHLRNGAGCTKHCRTCAEMATDSRCMNRFWRLSSNRPEHNRTSLHSRSLVINI